MSGPALEARGLAVCYGAVEVVHGVDLGVARAEIVVIIGPSGAGKSSLLLAAAGLIPCSGEVRRPARTGIVLQDHAVFPWMTVAANVAFGLADLAAAEREARSREVMALCGITELAARYPGTLSGGQRQRVAIARTLSTRPELVLLDEPFASLDVLTRAQMRAWLRSLASELGVALLMVTHDIDDALALADRVLVLVEGRVRRELALERRSGPRSAGEQEALRDVLICAMTEEPDVERDPTPARGVPDR